MKKSHKILRVAAAVVVFLLSYFVSTLPLIWGLTWIEGWPRFFARIFLWCVGFPVMWLILWRLPFNQKRTRMQKRNNIFCVICTIAIWVGFGALDIFTLGPKVEQYIHSPDGTNKALVLSRFGRSDSIYPVRLHLFYEINQRVALFHVEDVAFTWLDENTLEITRVQKVDGERLTDHIRW